MVREPEKLHTGGFFMIQIILLLIAIGIIHALWPFIKVVFKILVGILAVYLYFTFIPITLPITVIGIPIIFIMGIRRNAQNKRKEEERLRIQNKTRSENRNWAKQHEVLYTTQEIDQKLAPLAEAISNSDTNVINYKFTRKNMPYGRVNAFLNHFGKNIYTEDPYYFSCIPSAERDDFREYGLLVTRSGIYVSIQYKSPSEDKYDFINDTISFKGLKQIVEDNNTSITCIIVDDKNYDDCKTYFSLPDNITYIDSIRSLCQTVIDDDIGASMLNNQVVDNAYVEQCVVESEQKLKQTININAAKLAATIAGIGASTENYNSMYNETKNFMNGSRGGGYAAEYGNNTMDRLQGFNVESTAQILDEHGRQVKHGADRTVNGQEIQTKYYKTAGESIGAAFQHKQALYIRSDGSGKMMPIEVPKDQYMEAIKNMQNRIDNGEVPNVEPGESATNYVKKGFFTYAQAWNISRAGTIESLTVDIASGVVCSSSAAGITALLVFAQAVWNGQDLKAAAKASLETGFRVMGRGALIYTVTMQLTRGTFANPFIKQYTKDGIYRGFAGINNPIASLSNDLAANISKTSFAKSSAGKMLGFDNVTGKTLVGNSVTAVIIFGPDVCRIIRGRISGKQFLKNSTIGGVGLISAGIGQTLIPIPVIGGMIGGCIGGFVAKNILDNYIEDDAIQMFQILKEEFLEVVSLSGLSKEEFECVLNDTVGNDKLPRILQDMYASGEYRSYAHTAIMEAAITNVISRRKKITRKMMDSGMEEVIHEFVA